jgi:hypothetical protein
MKSAIYAVDKNIPRTRSEFERYAKLKKYQQYEAYPDPDVREFIEHYLSFNLSKEQMNNVVKNQLPNLLKIKLEMKKGVQLLYSAREQIYKCLMMFACFKKNFMAAGVTKEQFLGAFEGLKSYELRIGYQKIFNIEKRESEMEIALEILDPKSFHKIAVESGVMTPSSPSPEVISDTFPITLLACS